MPEELSPDHTERQTEVLRRLKKIEGQVRGVQRMILNQRDCAEILVQVAAIKAAINQVGLNVLSCHLVDQFAATPDGEKSAASLIEDFMAQLKKFL
ncbi:MAG: metal-sensitive transcriptional regulator [Heliobacteriaceae bacterium]|nr:metal-sensitive transcriptional regulator [Heliobacteriaceae bacterium]MDD4588459.1 metal-sensitive transcriptional regulator [Heliobacteriaceae bacterium]